MNYKQVDDLAAIWCEYGEMELRHENYDQALRILRVRYQETQIVLVCLIVRGENIHIRKVSRC